MDTKLIDQIRDHIIFETYRRVNSFARQDPDVMAELYRAGFEITKNDTYAVLMAEGSAVILIEFDVACHEASTAVNDLYGFDVFTDGGAVPTHEVDLATHH